MLSNLNSIKIKLKNYELDEECCDLEFLKKLNKIYTFKYNALTKIKDLYLFLYRELIDIDNEVLDDELSERFCFINKNDNIYANIDFNLIKFLQLQKISKKLILLRFNICVGGGNGAVINDLANIRINPSEPSHKNLPHVHIFKKNYTECVRINLKTFEKLKNDKYDLKDFFTRHEIKQILDILNKYQNQLIDFYYKIQNGEKPCEFLIEYNNKEIIFN